METFDDASLAKGVCRAAEALGVKDLEPRAMRHAGTAWDFAAERRNLNKVQKRSRRGLRRNVGRYGMAGPAAKGFLGLRAGMREQAHWRE